MSWAPRWTGLLLAVLLLPGAAAAQAAFVGGAPGLDPAEPDFEQSGLIAPLLGVDLAGAWRVSVMQAEFQRSAVKPKPGLALTVIGFERLFVSELGRSLMFLGALGAGWYDATLTHTGGTRRGSGLGLMADGGVRVFFTLSMFGELTYQYRDCGIQVSSAGDRATVDGGWQGLGLTVGWML